MHPGVVLLVIVFFAVVVIVSSLSLRYKAQELRHQERLKALEKGVDVPLAEPQAPWNPRVYLLRGMIWLFTGIGLLVFLFFAIATVPVQRGGNLAGRLMEVQTLRQRGVPEDELKELLAQKPYAPQGPPIGFALVGLIPIGVGLAYLLFYRSEKKRLAEEPENGRARIPAAGAE
jgi:hypothetical protein